MEVPLAVLFHLRLGSGMCRSEEIQPHFLTCACSDFFGFRSREKQEWCGTVRPFMSYISLTVSERDMQNQWAADDLTSV